SRQYKINPNSAEVTEMNKNFPRDNGGARLGLERRQFSYDKYIPERRSANDRRNGFDRRLKPRISDYYAWFDQKSNLRFEDDPDNEMPTMCT
ncbi:MAG: hypothetical protein PVF94_10040, partial [Desulfobacterales bacterium]